MYSTYGQGVYDNMCIEMRDIDIEDLGRRMDSHMTREFIKPTAEDILRYKELVLTIAAHGVPLSEKELTVLLRKHKFNHKRSFLFQIYLALKEQGHVLVHPDTMDAVRKTLQIKAVKSWSGITSITVFTSPYPEYTDERTGERIQQPFSCSENCRYCPAEPGQPRSYLKGEPGVLRANKNAFHCVRQMWDRMQTLYMIGSSPLKCEIIVSGGTWTSYPVPYREEFCRDIYYAANTFWQRSVQEGCSVRDRLSLEEEKHINTSALSRIVGLTIETRPDTVTGDELRQLRRYGVTRVQLGIQHTDDSVLEKVNRRCPTATTIRAIELLKRNGFKIDAHWMPNLPGATIEMDKRMFLDQLLGMRGGMVPKRWKTVERALGLGLGALTLEWEAYDVMAPELQVDQWKIYPTAITPWTEIEKWYREGTYVQYPEADMYDMLYRVVSLMFPWMRCNRLIRDIPHAYIYNEGTGSDNTNMRQQLDDELRRNGVHGMDIRNREVKNKAWDGSYILVVRTYQASNGTEYFISAESKDNHTLYGFVRLRLDDGWHDKVFPELVGAALIRELHTYGQLNRVGDQGQHVQHKGIGRTLMCVAENIAKQEGYKTIAVIAAEGTRPYYEQKLGYVDEGAFMTKKI